jgi:hypothetical protein
MDENFRGSNYRNDAEIAYRIVARTGKKIRFVPGASLRHLLANGGNRAFGQKDNWGSIGGSVGDYYFALKWLPMKRRIVHCLRRFVRAPISRYTAARPWRIPMIMLREAVAFCIAATRLTARRENYIKALSTYDIVSAVTPNRITV